MASGKRVDKSLDRTGGASPGPRWPGFIVVAAGALVYVNSFAGAFVFDDVPHVVNNPRIRSFTPIAELLAGSRPIVDLSLAVNYALAGLNVWGYHLFNLTVHLLAALVLYGMVRRTLSHAAAPRVCGRRGHWPALAVALLWTVHPLQTESVTYIIQRAESMMGLFYLLTLYCVMRGAHSVQRRGWYAAAVVCCALGMGCKAAMVTAPLAVLAYDRAFLSSSFGSALRQRWRLYVGLAATWGVLAACGVITGLLGSSATATAAVGLGYRGLTPVGYALTQPGVILQYLKLAFWPHALCLFYWRPVTVTTFGIVLPALVVLTLLAATVWALRKKPGLGLLGAWFFLTLAPTSSFVPIKDIMFEHRMYLPLASVVVLVVFAGWWVLERAGERWAFPAGARPWIAATALLAAASALGYRTVQRNRDYRTAEIMWRDVVGKRPRNAPARYNLANVLAAQGRVDEAVVLYNEALTILPAYPEAHNNLGNALLETGRLDQARSHFARALRLKPDCPEAHSNMGLALYRKGMFAESVPHFTEALRLKPDYPEALNHLGVAWLMQGKPAEAVRHLTEAIRLRPDYAEAHSNLGASYQRQGKLDQAVTQFTESLRIDPDNAISRVNLGTALADLGSTAEAIAEFRRALEIDPSFATARERLDAALRSRANGDP